MTKYIVFYNSQNGSGNAEVSHKKIKNIDDIRNIEYELIKQLHDKSIVVSNYKKIGWTWK